MIKRDIFSHFISVWCTFWLDALRAPFTVVGDRNNFTWWRHQMEKISALLAICAGNSPVPGEFPAQRPVTRTVGVFFDLHPNKRLSKQWWGWWFETLSCPLWRQQNEVSCIDTEPLSIEFHIGPRETELPRYKIQHYTRKVSHDVCMLRRITVPNLIIYSTQYKKIDNDSGFHNQSPSFASMPNYYSSLILYISTVVAYIKWHI